MGNSEKLGTSLWNATTGLSIYPANIYEGISKLILFTVIPIGFIGAVPVEILRNFSWELTFWMIIATAATTTIAIILFYIGLKRYESGNQIYVNS
jgi:ABC-2 type transport system permease protein